MKTKSRLFVLATSLFIYSCNGDKNESANADYSFNKTKSQGYISGEESKVGVLTAAYDTDGQPVVQHQKKKEQATIVKQKIIKNGSMRVESEDALKSKSTLSKKIKDLGGYFEKEIVVNNNRLMSFDLVVRIPAKNFEKLISSIESGGDMVSNKSITADDVTEDFYDVQTRLSNKRAYLKRYQELLNKANTIQDILDVEEKIRVLEEEIESAEGRLRYLSDQVGYSTLRLDLFEKKAYFDEPNENTFSDRVKRALSNGWSGIVHLAIALLTLWPFLVLGGILIFIFRRYRKRKKKTS